MKLAFTLSIKNIFGAKLRTFLNVFVLSFSFVVIIGLKGVMDGWDDQARRDSINWQFGQGQLIHEDYDPLDSFTILDGKGLIPENISGLTPILVHQASIYPQGRMLGATIKGIDLSQKSVLLPTKALINSKYNYPVIIGKRMAESSKLSIGDEVLIRWRDKNGTYDANRITVVDIFDSNVPAIDSGQIWMSIETLWQITGLNNQASFFIADKNYKHKPINFWKFNSQEELLKPISDLVAQKNGSQSVIYFLLLTIALLAIFDTQVLSVFRRQSEIGTYIALGMTRQKVIGIFTFEGSLYSVLALILATIYGFPLLAWFADVGFAVPPADQKMGIPIADTIFPIFGLKLVFGTIFLVLFASTVVSFLPTRKISKLDPILALKGKKQ